jgi:hypothetical protein
MNFFSSFFCLLALLIFFADPIVAQDAAAPPQESDAQELAKKLANPVASLISVPFQNNSDWGIGEANGSKNVLNIQPVIPISLTPKWNLITRCIIPVVTQHDITGEGTNQTGLSDATLSAFFSPKESKIIWGIGPAFLVPVATDDFLGTKKFGIGPTALVLRQANGWTYGALVNQLFSAAGDANRAEVNQLFIQPFLAYNWKSGAGVTLNAEMTQNWEGDTFTGFLNPVVSGVTRLGKQTISLAVGPRIPFAAPVQSKPAMGIRSVLTLVFPK